MTLFKRALTVIGLILLAGLLLASLADLPTPAVNLPAIVNDTLSSSGVSNPVTAVLLNFRGYDTLLEVAVLMLALIGMLAVGLPADRPLLSRNAKIGRAHV